jgi:hypothetical protein
MVRRLRLLILLLAIVGIAAVEVTAAPPPDHGNKGPKDHKVKQQKQHNGKDLVGNNIKANGRHQLHQNGKHTAYVDVSNGKIAGVVVKNADTGDVPVTKYKTNKKMAMGPRSGAMLAGYQQVQYEYVDTVWIGYGYIDEWGDEQIYWFPYDMILDGDTGAIEYVPVY